VPADVNDVVSFSPEEVITSEPTRAARLKWVILVDESAQAGLTVNAVACIAASTGAAVTGLIGPPGRDASGHCVLGLPWAGCSVLAAAPAALTEIRAKAAASDGVLVVDMPRSAQTNRVYDDYLAELAETRPEDLAVSATSIIGPRNTISKLVKNLRLLL
jgi:Protein of unknown function (DUF2000)